MCVCVFVCVKEKNKYYFVLICKKGETKNISKMLNA